MQHNQPDILLAIKLRVPRPRHQLVLRSHLLERLQEGTKQSLTLLSAPAGFGKTTLLAQWCAQSALSVAWLSLEPEDNEPMRFLSYLIAALQTVDPALGTNAQVLLEAQPQVSLERVLALLTNDILESASGNFVLVLDDYHLIIAEAIHRALLFFLEHLPSQMHLVIATRADPPLPLARLRVRGQLTEVRAAELRFASSEVSTFIQAVMGLDLPSEAMATLAARTEGWVAGLQLAALALQGRSDVISFCSAFGGSHRFILDYLSEEVLAHLNAETHSFLLHTSLLERLCGPLCDAVTGETGSQAMLERLEKANLFVVSLDDERRWYRYHHLFVEVLRSHLVQTQSNLVPELHRRASVWYQEHALIREAIHHLAIIHDGERIADLLESQGLSLGIGRSEHIQALLAWLNALPDALVHTRPTLCILHAMAYMHTNQLQEAEVCLQEAERTLHPDTPADQVRLVRGRVATIRANQAGFAGDVIQVVAFAQQALDLLPETETIMRTTARMLLAHAFYADGDVTAGREQIIAEAVVPMRATGNLSGILSILTALARFYFMQGKLRRAITTYEAAAQVVPERGDLHALPGSPSYYFGLGDILRERNEVVEADHLLSQSIELATGALTAAREVVIQSYLSFARLQMGRRDYHAALDTLNAFMQLADVHHFLPAQIAQGAAVQAQVKVAQGNLAEALRWTETSGLSFDDTELPYARELEYLILVRVYIAQGCKNPTGPFLQNALRLLNRLLEAAEGKARMRSVLEIEILQALTLSAQSEQIQAIAILKHALELAEPEGYMRLFNDEGPAMLRLLHQAQKHGLVSDYLTSLISAFGERREEESAFSARSPEVFIEPLTEREREVLQLIVAGASNREIARSLVVSLGTVKKHVSNICGKLGVQSRTQAIAQAHALHLIS